VIASASRFAGGLALWAVLACSPAVARADDSCAIAGTVEGIEVTIRLSRGLRRVRLAQPTQVAVTPLRTGLALIRTLDGELLEGTTRADLRFQVARAISLREGMIELEAGTPVERVVLSPRGPWARIDVPLGDGLHLRGVELPCAMIAVTPGSSDSPFVWRPPVAGPRWRARTARLHLFDRADGDASVRIDVAPESPARFVEIERRGRWVRLVIQTARGVRLRGWVHDEDLIR
jgi:hypothetical protein